MAYCCCLQLISTQGGCTVLRVNCLTESLSSCYAEECKNMSMLKRVWSLRKKKLARLVRQLTGLDLAKAAAIRDYVVGRLGRKLLTTCGMYNTAWRCKQYLFCPMCRAVMVEELLKTYSGPGIGYCFAYEAQLTKAGYRNFWRGVNSLPVTKVELIPLPGSRGGFGLVVLYKRKNPETDSAMLDLVDKYFSRDLTVGGATNPLGVASLFSLSEYQRGVAAVQQLAEYVTSLSADMRRLIRRRKGKK